MQTTTVTEFTIAPNDHVRLGVRFEDSRRPLVWLSVGPDGDLFFGSLGPEGASVKAATLPIPEGATFIDIRYQDALPVDPEIAAGAHSSLHASGILTSLGDRTNYVPLVGLDQQRWVSGFLFMHPRDYPAAPALRKRDVFVGYPVDDARPLEGCLLVAPLENWQVAPVVGAYQRNLVFKCRGLRRTPDLAVQFVLSTGVEGAWPPGTVTIRSGWINKSSVLPPVVTDQ